MVAKRRYALHGKPGLPTIHGLLVRRSRDRFVLHDAEILETAEKTHDVQGRLEVLRENVWCLERLT